MHFFTPRRCPTTNKIMYKTKVQALQAADDGYRTRGTRLWVYRCDSCGTWHLTHSAPIPEYGEGGGRGGHGDASRRKPMSRKRGYKPRRR
ncbi:MAG: hypothetical protein LKJ47_08715 [Bifidobacteriaceae bacterium]|nr:hypothetical protein [Bifidobacteriaceae bacterium]